MAVIEVQSSKLNIIEVADALNSILRTGSELHTDQQTIQVAIANLREIYGVRQVTVANNYISGFPSESMAEIKAQPTIGRQVPVRTPEDEEGIE